MPLPLYGIIQLVVEFHTCFATVLIFTDLGVHFKIQFAHQMLSSQVCTNHVSIHSKFSFQLTHFLTKSVTASVL